MAITHPHENLSSGKSKERITRSAKRLDMILDKVNNLTGRPEKATTSEVGKQRQIYSHTGNKLAIWTDGRATFITTPRKHNAPGFVMTAILQDHITDEQHGISSETRLAFFTVQDPELTFDSLDLQTAQDYSRKYMQAGCTRADIHRFESASTDDDFEDANIIMGQAESELGMRSGRIAHAARLIAASPLISMELRG